MIGHMNGHAHGNMMSDFYRQNRDIFRENRTFTDDAGSFKSKGHHISELKVANLNVQFGSDAETPATSGESVTKIQYSSFQAEVNRSQEGGFSFSVSIIQATMVIESTSPAAVEEAEAEAGDLIEGTTEVPEEVAALTDEDLEETAEDVAEENAEDNGQNLVASGAVNAAYDFAKEGEAALKILEGMTEPEDDGYLL